MGTLFVQWPFSRGVDLSNRTWLAVYCEAHRFRVQGLGFRGQWVQGYLDHKKHPPS